MRQQVPDPPDDGWGPKGYNPYEYSDDCASQRCGWCVQDRIHGIAGKECIKQEEPQRDRREIDDHIY